MQAGKIEGVVVERPFAGTVSVQRIWVAAGLVLLNIADVVLTRAILDRGGVESNPLMQELMLGFAAPLALKIAVAGVVAVLLLACPPTAKLGPRAAVAVLIAYGGIILWNIGVLLTLVVR